MSSRVALVTGGAKGIGRGISLALARMPDVVMVISVDKDVTAGERLVAEGPPGKIANVCADLGLAEECQRSVAEAVAQTGRLDLLVNNVGIQTAETSRPVHELPDDMWHRLMDVNLSSYFRMSKWALPHMMTSLGGRGGAIINIASAQGHQSQQSIPAYAASKGAILSLTRQMALDYAQEAIRVMCVCPGTVRTPLADAVLADHGTTYDDCMHDNLVLGGVGDPGNIADVVTFLAGPGAAFMTGEFVNVDGGIMAKGSWTT